jgi:hypothetical protein
MKARISFTEACNQHRDMVRRHGAAAACVSVVIVVTAAQFAVTHLPPLQVMNPYLY